MRAIARDLLRELEGASECDLMSALLDAELEGRRLDDRTLLGFCFLLVVGGNDTTMNLIGDGAVLLAHHPDIRSQRVSEPDRIPDAIEEMLRLEAPAQMLPRRPVRDVELHGVTIPADSRALVCFGSANLDERVFPDPLRFDLDRAEKRHLALGQGAPDCMGASMARMEGRIAVEELLARYPDCSLLEEPGWITSRRARSHPHVRVELAPPSTARSSGRTATVPSSPP